MVPGRTALVDTLRICAGVLVILVGAAAFSVATGPSRYTSYAGRSSMSAILTLATGTALVAAGLVTSLGRRPAAEGDLAQLIGLTWFCPTLVGWTEGPPLVRGIALMGTGMTLPLVLHLVVRGLTRPARRWRTLVVATYGVSVAAAVLLALFRDPYLDPSCFANCTVNPFLVHSSPDLVRGVDTIERWFVAGAGLLLAGLGVAQLAARPSSMRRRSLPLAAPAIVVGASVAAHAAVSLQRPKEDPSNDILYGLNLVTCVGLGLLAGGLCLGVVLQQRRRQALARLASELAATPVAGRMEAALGSALGDPGLRLAYPVEDPTRLVDARGRRVTEDDPGDERQVTTLTRQGRAIAVVTHASTNQHLENHLGSAVRLGLDNERLQAESLARLDELRASRERFVEAGDLERRRLERDLHDGAQQRLLALSYDVRLATATAAAEGDDRTETSLRRATEITQQVLGDLRELARGIFPAALAEVGLAEALRSFADVAPIPIDLRVADQERHAASVEAAGYFAVVEAVEDASHRGATSAQVFVHSEQSRVVLVLHDNGTPRSSPMMDLVDRVGALGGTTTLEPTTCRLEIPCA